MLQVIAYLDLNQELYHTSYVYTGLLQLAAKGTISLDLRSPAKLDWRKSDLGDACVHLDLIAPGSRPKALCVDLWDKSGRFSAAALGNCDVYYKRSYFQSDVETLPLTQQRKVAPFGLNYSCSTASMTGHLLRAGFQQWPITKVPKLLHVIYDYWRLRRPKEYLWQPRLPKEPVILLQTRVWEDHEVVGDDAEAINSERTAIVRALKSAFGDRFVGGLLPNRLARSRYPDLLTTLKSDPQSYTHLNRRALIGVYTRGLHHSTAWKLGEYFAASMCVVAEPIRNKIPVALEQRRHFLAFGSADECVRACEVILGSDDLQQALRSSAYEYYLQHIDPAAHMGSCLENARTIDA